MRKFRGVIRTNRVCSECEFEFTTPDDYSKEQIEEFARDLAFEYIEWTYQEDELERPKD